MADIKIGLSSDNLGSGTGIAVFPFGFKSLLPGSGISISDLGNELQITALSSETTTASNLGTGIGVFAQLSGNDLQFKSLVGTGLTITSDSGTVYLTANDPVGVFVHITGETMTGNLVVPALSGTNIYRQGVELFGTSGTAPINVSNGLVGISSGSAVSNGYISSYDWSRFNAVAVGSGNYVLKSGDTMTGTLNLPVLSGNTISGTVIRLNGNDVVSSGTSSGTGFTIFNSKNINDLVFNTITGIGTVQISYADGVISVSGIPSTVYTAPTSTTDMAIMRWSGGSAGGFLDSNLVLTDNGDIVPLINNTSNLGDSSTTFNTIYVEYVGGTLNTQDLIPTVSGVYNLGTSDLPYSGVYTDGIFVSNITVFAAVDFEVPLPPVDGFTTQFTLLNEPLDDTLEVYRDGVLLNISGVGAITEDYTLSANVITMFTAPEADQSLVCKYKYATPTGIGFYGHLTTTNIISGNIYNGSNLGAGAGVFSTVLITGNVGDFQFKSIVGSGIIVTNDADTIYLEGVAGDFIPTSGGTLSGDLLTNSAYTNNVGSSGVPFAQMYAGTGNFHAVSGLSPIDFLSNINLKSGINITTATSGIASLGTESNPFAQLWVTSISGVQLGVIYTGVSPISITGDSVSIASGSSISNGYISSGDWTIFNNKQVAGNYLVSGTATTSDIPEGSREYYTGARVSGVIETQKAQPLGLATLDAGGLIPNTQLPPLAITDTFVVASSGAQVALIAEVGDVAVRTDENKSYILRLSGASVFSNWQELLTPTDSVLSVNNKTGAVSLSTDDILEGTGTRVYYTDARVDAHLSGTSPISYSSGLISIASGSAVTNGYISSGDWTRFDSIANASGNFVLKAGDTMTGTLNVPVLSGTTFSGLNYAVVSGGSILPTISGAGTGSVSLGSAAKPFSGLYVSTVNSYQTVVQKFNEVPLGIPNGVLTAFTLAYAPYNNSLQLFKNGIYLYPSGVGAVTEDYSLSGTTITTIGTTLPSGTSLICSYTYLG